MIDKEKLERWGDGEVRFGRGTPGEEGTGEAARLRVATHVSHELRATQHFRDEVFGHIMSICG